jgi:hypothetical protein
MIVLAAAWVRADEGQWPPQQLAAFPESEWKALRARGLTLTPEQLWDGNGGGLMTAAVNLGGCTAAFVSPDGLIATNHHCAFAAIQLASTPERNYLRDGFVSRTRTEEAPARGGANRVLVIKRFTDVTDRVRGPASGFARAKSDLERYEAVERARREIVAGCEKQPSTRCDVAAFYEGREYRLMEQLELRDVRLVYAPPRGVGDYGGEDDNFRWPRHTGDFSILRAYVGPDGRPAAYAPENVPFHPARWLTVSDRGVAPGDLVMVMGYPGRTQRFLDSESVANQQQWFFPLRARTLADLIAILDDAGKADPDTALRVAGAIKGLGNGMTNARGQVAGLARNRVVERVRGEEGRLRAFVARDATLPPPCRTALDDVRAIAAADRVGQERRFFLELIEGSSGYLGSALSAVRWAQERAKPEADREAGYLPRDAERARWRSWPAAGSSRTSSTRRCRRPASRTSLRSRSRSAPRRRRRRSPRSSPRWTRTPASATSRCGSPTSTPRSTRCVPPTTPTYASQSSSRPSWPTSARGVGRRRAPCCGCARTCSPRSPRCAPPTAARSTRTPTARCASASRR